MREGLKLCRSVWIWILPSLAIILGIVSVVTAQYMPQILDALAPGITMPDPTSSDVAQQWEKNVIQLYVFVALASAVVSSPRDRNITYLRIHGFGQRHIVTGYVYRAGLLAICLLAGWVVTAVGSYLTFGVVDSALWSSTYRAGMLSGMLMAVTVLASTFLPTMGALAVGAGSYVLLNLATLSTGLTSYTPAGLLQAAPGVIPFLSAGLIGIICIAWACRRMA